MKTNKIKSVTLLIDKICTKCKLFSSHTLKGKHCRECVSKNSHKYVILNKEHRKGYYSKWRDENVDGIRENKKKQYLLIKDSVEYKQKIKDYKKKPEAKEQSRDYHYRKKYNISTEIYNKMYDNQNGKCDICYKNFNRLAVDHNHTTGLVRGLLCYKCNVGIGLLQDNINILKNSVLYLEKYIL